MPDQTDAPSGVQFSPVEAASPAPPGSSINYDSGSHFDMGSHHGTYTGDYQTHENLHVDTPQQHLDQGSSASVHGEYSGPSHFDVTGSSANHFHYSDFADHPASQVQFQNHVDHFSSPSHFDHNAGHHAGGVVGEHSGHDSGHSQSHDHGGSHGDHGSSDPAH